LGHGFAGLGLIEIDGGQVVLKDRKGLGACPE
jgi:hypothetical protein